MKKKVLTKVITGVPPCVLKMFSLLRSLIHYKCLYACCVCTFFKPNIICLTSKQLEAFQNDDDDDNGDNDDELFFQRYYSEAIERASPFVTQDKSWRYTCLTAI